MNKKHFVGVAVLIMVLIIGIAGFAARNMSSSETTENSSSDSSTAGEAVTVEGTVICLSLKDAGTAQNTSCAIGIKSDDGKSYALYSDDPSITGSLPSGSRVRVKGGLVARISQYDTVGTINLGTLERL